MKMNIAIIVSRYNPEITERLLQGAVQRLHELGIDPTAIHITRVPGAVEIPLAAQQYAKREDCSAVICLGAVIRGETDHYDYVCQQVSYGCQRIALDFDLPVIFGVLTTDDEEQALERSGGAHGHKGREAADAAVEMIALVQKEDCACEVCE
jgi:6,7-dimethyl-8-ribityllumazine synthase